MRGDYIECDGPRTEPEFLDELVRLLRPATVQRRPMTYPVLELSDQRTTVFVDVDPNGVAPPLIAISDRTDDDRARHNAARAIHDALAAGTTWRLRWSSDSSCASSDGPALTSSTQPQRLTALPTAGSTQRPADAAAEVDESLVPVDLLAIRADDRLLDLLASGQSSLPRTRQGSEAAGAPDIPVDREERQLFAMLESLRAEVESETFPELITVDAAYRAITGQRPARQRTRVMPAILAAAVCVVIGLSGLLLAATRAEPGDPLWGVSTVIDGSRAASVRAAYQVTLAVSAARKALAQGRESDAQRLITTVQPQLALIHNPQRKDQLTRESTNLLITATHNPPGRPVTTDEHGTDLERGRSGDQSRQHQEQSNHTPAIRTHEPSPPPPRHRRSSHSR